jgi:hypothetical protein
VEGDFEGASETLQRALDLTRKADARGGPGMLIELLALVGKVAALRDDVVAADAAMQEGVDLARQWRERAPEDRGRAFSLANVALDASSYYIDTERYVEARALLDEVLPAARLAVDGGPTISAQVLATVHLELAHLDVLAGDDESARAHFAAARSEAGLCDENQGEWLSSYRRLRELYSRFR